MYSKTASYFQMNTASTKSATTKGGMLYAFSLP